MDLESDYNQETLIGALRQPKERPWPVKALTLMLFLETAALLALAFLNFLSLDLSGASQADTALGFITNALSGSIIFSALALLALLATLGFLGLWRPAWTISMLVQGLVLLVLLIFYYMQEPAPVYVYPFMLYGIVMVIYLHHPAARLCFQSEPSQNGGTLL